MSRSSSPNRLSSPASILRLVPLCVAIALALAVVQASRLSAPLLMKPAPASETEASAAAEAGPELVGVPAAQFSTKPLRGVFPAVPIRVIDGDTVEMRVSIWLGQDVITRVRMRGIDAPELRARCQEELTKAEAAKQLLASLLGKGEVFLSEVGYDKYGTRVVARIVDASSADLGLMLIERGLARHYNGGKRQSWCTLTKEGPAPDLPPG